MGLSDYRAVIQAKPVDLEGDVIRKIGLADFRDVEAIEYIGGGLYLIADETDQSVSFSH